MKLDARKSLLIVFAVFITGSIYRAAHFYLTGFFVPDEWGYAYVHLGNIQYQGRYFLQLFNSFVLPHNTDQLVIIMPFYFMFWLSIGILSAYGAMKLLYDDQTITKTLLLSLTLPVFLLFSVALLSELPAFALSMLGIYLTIWFWKRGNTPIRYLAPFLVAMLFVAADFTRANFIVFQLLGFIPFLVAESRKTNVRQGLLVSLLFIGPAVFFLFYPYPTGVAIIPTIQITLFGSHPIIPIASITNQITTFIETITTTITTITSASIGGSQTITTVITTTITRTSTAIGGSPAIGPQGSIFPKPPDAFNPTNMIWVFAKGIVTGWNPVVFFLIGSSSLLVFYKMVKKEKDSFIVFWPALLALGTFGGAAFVYSSVTTLPLSTALRYSYDALPAYFLLAPIVLSRIKKGKSYGLIIAGLIISGLLGVPFYQGALQSGLGGSYPYLNGNQSFLTLDYRTPYAQMRDYFHAHPAPQYVVVGEPKAQYLNMTYDWKFTPNVSDLNVIFYPYSQLKFHNLTSFYLYIERPNFGLQLPYGNYSIIHDDDSFYFANVTLAR